ncbi:uncharacterized protein LOC144349244 [Saccoglossus kowalevskii]
MKTVNTLLGMMFSMWMSTILVCSVPVTVQSDEERGVTTLSTPSGTSESPFAESMQPEDEIFLESSNTNEMTMEELLKSWLIMANGAYCHGSSILTAPRVASVRRTLRQGKVILRLHAETDDVNYFVTYPSSNGTYSYVLRSRDKSHIPLHDVPFHAVVLVEVFAIRRCNYKLYWSKSTYFEMKVNEDERVTIITPAAPSPCEIPRAEMALEGKMSENSVSVTVKPEPSIEHYLFTVKNRGLRHQSRISNGPEGFGISGLTISDLLPRMLYSISILGESQCIGKTFHGAPVFFFARTIGARMI